VCLEKLQSLSHNQAYSENQWSLRVDNHIMLIGCLAIDPTFHVEYDEFALLLKQCFIAGV